MDRREFIKSLAASGLFAGAAGVGCSGGPSAGNDGAGRGSSAPGTAPSAGPWGAVPKGADHALLPAERQPEGMLEIFMLGGASPWETFYTVPEFCDPSAGGPYAGQQWWSFQEGGETNVADWFSSCGPGSMPLFEPFAADSEGVTINLGPFIHPLRSRPDILARMRVWVMSHQVEPHAIAIPLAVAGHGVSNPRMTGFGTHIQRHFGDRSGREAPFSYTIYMSSFDRSNNGAAATALGLHPSSAQPVALQLGPDPRLPRQLPRPGAGGHKTQLDALVDYYENRFSRRLSYADGTMLRSSGFRSHASARQAMKGHQALVDLLPSEFFELAEITLCSPDPMNFDSVPVYTAVDETTAAIGLARHLLTAGDNAARYVQVMDAGIYTDPAGQGYDSHAEHVLQQGPNLSHMCEQLVGIINRPGEEDPTKLDLDRHFVLLNTEFGRAPVPEITPANPRGAGSNHWPWGYVVVGFGGFVDEERAGVVGAIGENSYAISAASPTDHRAAMLLAMGVWPFSETSFAIGEIQGMTDSSTQLDAALKIRGDILGYSA